MAFAGNQPNRKNVDFTPQASAPADAIEGSTIYHETSGLIFYTGSEWISTSGSGGGGASALNDLTDVDTTGLAANKALVYDGSSWVPAVMHLNTNVAGDLDQLDDVNSAGLADGSGLAYSQSSREWVVENFNLGHHVTGELNDLSNVSTSPSIADSLVWDGSRWAASGITGASTLVDLTDTTISTPASGDFLQYNGSAWLNQEVATASSGYMWKIIANGSQTTGTELPSVDFNGSGYSEIKIKLTNIDVSADTFLKMTLINSVGADIDNNYQYAHMGGATDGANPSTDSSTSSTDGVLHYAASDIDTNSNGQSGFEFTIQNPTDFPGSLKELSVLCQGGFYRTDGRHITTRGTLIYDGAITPHGFKIETGKNSANIACDYQVFALVPVNQVVFSAQPTVLSDLTDVTSATPASGDMLYFDGSNWKPRDMSSSYEWALVQEASISGSSSVSLSGIKDAEHGDVREAKMILKNTLLSADGYLEARVIDGGGVVKSGISEYRWSNAYAGSSTIAISQDVSDDAIRLSYWGSLIDALSNISMELRFLTPGAAANGVFECVGGARKTDGVKTQSNTSAECSTLGNDIDGMQMFPSTGTFSGSAAKAELWVLRRR